MTKPFDVAYDFIVIGAGCAGLSLLVRMLDTPSLLEKKILLIDKAPNVIYDRTWCFWENGNGYFEPIIHKQWQKVAISHNTLGRLLPNLETYTYKMLRGQDFYEWCMQKINLAPNITIKYEEVTNIDPTEGKVITTENTYAGGLLFSSVLLDGISLRRNEMYLLQHFKGWWIETQKPVFDETVADIMNFTTSQQHGCTFLYVLPISTTKALVEYTLFSPTVLESKQYDEGIQEFLTNAYRLSNNDFTITSIEQGVIPMTNASFPKRHDKIIFIGTAGGQTKPSSGYTFQFIQKQSETICKALSTQRPIPTKNSHWRFLWYDSVLLRVLNKKLQPADDLFYLLFKKNKTTVLFRFLDNASNWWEELQIMHSTKKRIFIIAGMLEGWNMLINKIWQQKSPAKH